MSEHVEIGGMQIEVTRKNVKNVHLSVHPPDGRITLVAPETTRLDVARSYAITRLDWIRRQQQQLATQARETPRQYVGRETHYLWGRRYLLRVAELEQKPFVSLDHRTIRLTVRPGSARDVRQRVVHEWHLRLMHEVVPKLIAKWEKRLGVSVKRYHLQQMRTKWGSCSPQRKAIRLNSELVKKPRDLLEYVVVHELIHLLEPRHSPGFFQLLDQYYPSWPEARKELNELPVPTLRQT